MREVADEGAESEVRLLEHTIDKILSHASYALTRPCHRVIAMIGRALIHPKHRVACLCPQIQAGMPFVHKPVSVSLTLHSTAGTGLGTSLFKAEPRTVIIRFVTVHKAVI